ncbi:DUF4190 domain-containing protein [Jatrophihabitans endophyticus]|uniref:DUF4190 domain-containing protein n=1 Tax=Jatrophihabitans endophyticus TaxID=1206085 RepID=UPI0019D9608C|nr:DUF4190 domain-containing protein [Jatrophihabitans endophyticus]MBE7188998.1 DUF4190 domain-containing protein [Jatrophihabitans endophyticus]
MTSPSGGPPDGEQPPVNLDKPSSSEPSEPFDPYRFGKPDVPPPPEYAPPGYVPDRPETAPPTYPGAPGQSGPPPSGYPPMPTYGGYPPHPGQYPPPYPGQQPPYGMPPYGPYPGARQGNGKAVAGMVLGIASIVFCWINFFNLVFIVPGIIFSLLGLSDSKTRGTGRGQAIAGLVCVAVGVVLTVVISILEFNLVHHCSGIQTGTKAYRRCVRDNI